ncbi:MAG: ATP synthase F1 subunit gamma [Candidatus Omnitrophota bacterium]|nr:ATP synthase F1 subunit gamma [Candidatus Omnitrophota bacterium]
MIQSLQNIKRRIRSVESTRKITRAMQMISAAKLNRVRSTLFQSRPYFNKLETILNDLLASGTEVSHPLLEKRPGGGSIALCVMTSDTGLCGTYNHAVMRSCGEFMRAYDKDKVKLVLVGKEGYNFFKARGFEISGYYVGLHGKYSYEASKDISDGLIAMFLNNIVDEVYTAHTHFNSMLRYKIKVQKILNIEYTKNEAGLEYLVEPDIRAAADSLIPAYISEKLRLTLLDAFASEHSSRMIAMKAATDNADEFIDTLTLMRNKARQASITREVIEIASAAEVLRD